MTTRGTSYVYERQPSKLAGEDLGLFGLLDDTEDGAA